MSAEERKRDLLKEQVVAYVSFMKEFVARSRHPSYKDANHADTQKSNELIRPFILSGEQDPFEVHKMQALAVIAHQLNPIELQFFFLSLSTESMLAGVNKIESMKARFEAATNWPVKKN